jgi:hypothetical protein
MDPGTVTFPQSKVLAAKQASYNRRTGVITFRGPRKLFGNPAPGTRLYSITAFSATSTDPQSSATLFNLVDATTPFELVVGPPPRLHSRHSHFHRTISHSPRRARGFTG